MEWVAFVSTVTDAGVLDWNQKELQSQAKASKWMYREAKKQEKAGRKIVSKGIYSVREAKGE